MDSIRVDTGVKKIEVNDEGETISLNFADQSFPARYFAMVDEFEASQSTFQKEAQELDKECEQNQLSDYERSRKVAAFNLKVHAFFKERVDGLLERALVVRCSGISSLLWTCTWILSASWLLF